MANNIIGSTTVLVLAVVGLVGCGSASSRGRFLANEAGASGSSAEETGGRNGSGGGSAAGETGGTTGGNLGQAGSTAETGGGNGTGGGPCVPRDCLTAAIELSGYDPASGDPVPEACGVIPSGCGNNYIDCGGCDTAGTACGRGEATGVLVRDLVNGGMIPEELPGIANICDGGCHNMGVSCVTSEGNHGSFFACTLPSNDPNSIQPSNVLYACESQYSEYTFKYHWCCPSSV